MFENVNRKKLNIVLVVILAIFLIAVILISNLMFNFALNPNSKYTIADLLSVDPTPKQDDQSTAVEISPELQQFNQEAAAWFETSETTSLTSEDGLTLNAHYLPLDNSHRYAIICHGYGGNSTQMSGYAKRFHNLGFSVLAPDARAHGESEGEYYGMGWPERKDILDWANQLIARDPDAEIVLFGVSMGGATVMMTAGEELPEQIKCIVEDCGYTSVWDEFSLQLSTLFSAPEFPLMYTTDLICRMRAEYGFQEASSVEQLKKAEAPMLFIHGEEDTFVPYSMLDQVYNACASAEKEKLTIPGAGHGVAASVEPDLYWSTVESFVNKHLN